MDLAQVFLTPRNANHRQYEALRAYFVERLPGAEVAQRFGYTLGSFHQLVHQLRRAPDRTFFAPPARPGVKPSDRVRQQILALRKQNLSIYDISAALKKEDVSRSPEAGEAHAGRSGRRPRAVAGAAERAHQVRRTVLVSPGAGRDALRPRDRAVWSAGHADGPRGPCL